MQTVSCRRRIFGRTTSPIRHFPDFNIPSPISNRQIITPRNYTRLGSLTNSLNRPFQFIPSFRGPRHRPSRFQCLQLFFIFALIILILLAVKKKLPSRSGWHEKPRMIDAYRSEIESLKNIFPEQSGWLWFVLDTLALDLIGQPAYKSEDQIRSVIFGVPQNTGLTGSCLAWEVTQVINKVGGSLNNTPVNFSFADMYCVADCHLFKNKDGVLHRGSRKANVGSALWEEYTLEEQLHKLLSDASQSGQTALFINHLQAASNAGLELLIRPYRYLNEPKLRPSRSLRLIFYMVHLPLTRNSRVWTVSNVRDYIVNLWPNLEPEVELLLKTRLVGNVVLVRPLSSKS